jgi:cob(I)alamin adenosyltransferase
MSKIYTKTGDRGKTSLFDSKKVFKSDKKVDAYGTIDELNSLIGVASSFIKIKSVNKELEEIQNDLLEIGSSLAVSQTLPVPQLSKRPEDFEKQIDRLTSQMPVLTQFILPGGGIGGAFLHVARTVARRAERKIVAISRNEEIDPLVLIYLNRLSDLLFTYARYVNFKEKIKEKVWRKK